MTPQTILQLDNDLCTITAQVDLLPDVPVIHCNVKSWGRTQMKLLQFCWNSFKQELRQMGYRQACSIIPEGDERLEHFQLMFGMREIDRINHRIIYGTEV